MEQKTEVSQAVEERRLFEQWAGDSRYKFVALQKMSGDRYVHPGVQADWEVWQARAALKAQPAPAEAAQGMTNAERVQAMNPFKFVPWSKEAEMIEGWTKAEKERNEAQGEDSARLDAERYQWLCEKFGVTWLPCFLEDKFSSGYIEDGKVSIDAAIDRARASAETGGVKS